MSLLATDAVVLHVLDYSETSRIFRLATRDAGLVSALARGARRSGSRYGSALGLFAEGVAQLSMRANRDLQTLSSFEVVHAHGGVAADLERFAAASALAELVLRFGSVGGAGADDTSADVFAVLSHGLADIARSPAGEAREAGLAAAWHLVSVLGFAPVLAHCSSCHAAMDSEGASSFSNIAGGMLCARCASMHPRGRQLRMEDRRRIALWCGGSRLADLEPLAARAHQRLLREFLAQHLADGRALKAFDAWERGALGDA